MRSISHVRRFPGNETDSRSRVMRLATASYDISAFTPTGRGFIRRYVAWAPTRLENIEMLEQLRVLWYGEKIHVAVAAAVPGTDWIRLKILIVFGQFLPEYAICLWRHTAAAGLFLPDIPAVIH